ncbi:MAG: ATP-binding protein [Bacteroidales bacterium]|jgi:two-component system nitrogen regulation sensor histidine kinase NtrY|nr:ATP-binding protein [Bacteroidales bacterium]
MKFSRFRISIAIQLILIAATTLSFFWTLDQEYMLITSSSLVILWILQLIYLFWYLQKVNRDIIKFITAIKYDDVSIGFNKDKKVDKSFEQLHYELNKIIHDISEVRSDKEIEHQYFQNTIKHIGTGILTFDESGKIEICNDAALNLLNRHNLKDISELEKTQAGLADSFKELKPGNNKLIKLSIDNEIVQLSVKAANFKIKERKIKLLSLQNIKTEIDQSEVDAWQKLIRVLTHEIMNSVSPIKLLSGSLIEMFEENDKIKTIEEIDNKTIEDSVLGLKTIRKRSMGLSNFVETYKNLTQIPKANFSEFKIINLFDHINTLLKSDLEQKSIDFNYNCTPKDLIVNADEKLIEQVLINLIKNASEALLNCEKPTINLYTELVNDRVLIKISDNGKGISPEVLDNIFIPFFTTKEKGSGIGLSLSRQIMHLHGGNVSVKSKSNVETVFTLHF